MKRLCENNVDYKPESFSGCLALVLRPMSVVQQGCLEANHTFPDREILAMPVAEEANLQGINMCLFAEWSSQLPVYWAQIFSHCSSLRASRMACLQRQCLQMWWFWCIVDASKPEKLTSPFRTKWIVPLILPIIVNTPAILNKKLRQALLAYGSDTSLTDSILQEARTEAKAQLFDKADENVKYAEGMKSELEKRIYCRILTHKQKRDSSKCRAFDDLRGVAFC